MGSDSVCRTHPAHYWEICALFGMFSATAMIEHSFMDKTMSCADALKQSFSARCGDRRRISLSALSLVGEPKYSNIQ